MAKPLGTCSNCLRPNMKISSAGGNGLCGSCQLAIAGTEPGSPDREAKLQAAAEKFRGLPKLSTGRKSKKWGDEDRGPKLLTPKVEGTPEIKPQSGEDMSIIRPPAPTKVEESRSETVVKKETLQGVNPPVFRGAFIDFDNSEDVALMDKIVAIAKKERRTVSAQILYFLDKEMKFQEQECR